MRTRSCSWLSLLLLLGAANHAAAADGDTYARVCVTNAQGIRVMLDPPGAPQPLELAARDAQYEARISGREALKIDFCDKNPVLFTYSVGELKTTPLEDVAALAQIASAIKDFGVVAAGPQLVLVQQRVAAGTVKTLTVSCDKPTVESINGIRLADLKRHIGSLLSLHSGIAAAIEATHDQQGRLKDKQTEMSDELAKLRHERALLASVEGYATARMTGQPIPVQFQDGRRFASFEEFELSLATSDCRAANIDVLQVARNNLDFIANRGDKLATLLDALETFSTALQAVGETSTAATLHYDSKSRRQQPLTLAANATFAKFFSPATKQFTGDAKKVGTITINVEPQLALRLKIAPGVIYSFVKQPKFSTEANDSGGFTTVQQESNYAAASGVVAVNITRDRYMRENVRPFLQIGLAPKKDEFAFLLGGGIALDDANNTVLSFGAIYQERNKLGPGLSVGGTLTSADDLKTDTEFEAGFYVGVSYNLNNSK